MDPHRLPRFAALFAIAAAVGSFAAFAEDSAVPNPDARSKVLFENGTGFRWGLSGNAFVMARTQDTGKTWRPLDLGSLAIDLGALSPSQNGRPSSVWARFSDPSHGLLVWSTNGTLLHVAATADGGASWRGTLALSTDAVLERVIFPGPGRACLLAEMPEGMMHTTMTLIATDDYGATWTASSLEHGDGVHAWTFRSPTEGFVSVFYPAGVRILFYRTEDGGKSWQSVDLPLPPGLEEPGGTTPDAPVFSGPDLSIGRLEVEVSLPDGSTRLTYDSNDSGKTWTYSR